MHPHAMAAGRLMQLLAVCLQRFCPAEAITELEAVVDVLRDIVELLEKEEGVEK